jgi:hypothetical protein
MAAILATVDIEDLATAKVKGIKDALTDLVQTQQQLAASNAALASGTAGVIASMGASATTTGTAAKSLADYVAKIAAAVPVVQQAATGIAALGLHIQNHQAAMQGAAQILTVYGGGLAAVAQAARDGSAPLQAQASALSELADAANAGVVGLKEHAGALNAMMMQVSQGVPLTKAQAEALDEMAAGLADANREALGAGTAMQQLAAQQQQATAAIKESYSGLQLLTSQLTEGVTVTKLQADALAELSAVAQAGNGFTKEQAATLAELSTALKEGVTLTAEQAATLEKLTAEYAAANAATLGFKQATEQTATAVEQLLAVQREEEQAIRQTYSALELLSDQIKADTTLTQEQTSALRELQATLSAQGFGAAANTLGELAEAGEKNEKATEGQTEALQKVSSAYGDAHEGALNLKDVTTASIGVFDKFHISATLVAGVLGVLGASALHYAEQASHAAARSEVLNDALNITAKNAHQSNLAMLVASEQLKDHGVISDAAAESVMKLVQAELSLADAGKLVQVAQNVAVISGTSVTDVMERLTRAVEFQSVRMLKQFGIIVNLQKAYADYGREIGKEAKNLDDLEKKQALLNAVIEKGSKFAGAHEAAMDRVGVRYESLTKLADDVLAKVGEGLLPVFNKWVTVLKLLYEAFLTLSPGAQQATSALIVFLAQLALIGSVLTGAKLLGITNLFAQLGPAVTAAGAAMTAARSGVVPLTSALGLLKEGATANVAAAGLLRTAWVGIVAFFGSSVTATIVLVTVAIAALTAAYTYFTSGQEETIQRSVEHVASVQKEIDAIHDLVGEIGDMTTTVNGHLKVIDDSTEGQEAYNQKLNDLIRLVPDAVKSIDAMTGASYLNRDAIDAMTASMEEYRNELRETARTMLPTTEAAAAAAKAAYDAIKSNLDNARAHADALQAIPWREMTDAQRQDLAVSLKRVTALDAELKKLHDRNVAAQAKLATDKALTDSTNVSMTAVSNLNKAFAAQRAELVSAAGGADAFAKKLKSLGLEKEFRLLDEGMRMVRGVPKPIAGAKDPVQALAAEVSAFQKLWDQKEAAQKRAAEQETARVKAAVKAVNDLMKTDAVETARYTRLNEILGELTVGSTEWKRAVEAAQPILNSYAKSAEFGSKALGALNVAIDKSNQFIEEFLPQETITKFQNFDKALQDAEGDAGEYNRVVERGASIIAAWRAMNDGQRAQLGDTTRLQKAATEELENYTRQLEMQAKLEQTQELGQARLDMMDRQREMLRDLTREEEDAQRRRRDASIAADEAIKQSRLQMQDEMMAETLKGQDLLDYQTRRRIDDIQHRYEFEKEARQRALDDEARAVEQRIELAEEEIARRAELAIRARDFEIRMMKEKAAAAAAFAAERPGDVEAQKDAERLSRQAQIAEKYFDAYRDGIAKIRDEELRLQQTTNTRLRATVAANQKAADEISAQQKTLVDEQIEHILKLADAHSVAAELAKKVWSDVAGAVSKGLFDMLKDGRTFAQGMKGLWENNVKPALIGVWESIRDSVLNIMEEMLQGWIKNLLKMKTATKGADLASGFAAMSAGDSAGADWQGPVQGSKGGLFGKGWFGKGQSTGQNVIGGLAGGVIGAQVGYGVGRQTGSRTGGALSGAAAGAAAGAAFGGPWGALIGGGIGLVAGIFGANKARKEAEKARDEYIKAWTGGLDALKTKAAEAGVSLDALNKAKTPEKVAAAIKDLEEAFRKLDEQLAVKKGREEYIKSFERGLDTLKERAALAGISLDALLNAATAQELQDAIDGLNTALAELEKREILAKAKSDLATTYAQMQALSKQAQLVGFDLRKLYDADTIEEFNRQQERLNQLLAEQQERLQALSSATQGLETWATGFSQTLQKGFEGAFPKAAEVEEFYKKFKEAQDRGFKGTALDFSKQIKKALPMEEFMKLYQEAVDKGFKGTYEQLAKHLQMPQSFLDSLKKTAAGAQDEFQSLGITAAASFAAIVRETGDLVGAMNAIAPTLDQLIDAQDKWGLKADESFSSLIQFRRIIKDNQDVFNSISGLTQALKGLTDANALTEESFDAMGRTAVEKYNTLVARTGDAKLSLLSMQPTLQALWEAQKKFGFTVDDATQALIDQGIANGTVGANMQSVDQKMLDVLGLIAQALGVTKDKLDDLGLAGATAGDGVTAGLSDAEKAAREVEIQAAEAKRELELLQGATEGGVPVVAPEDERKLGDMREEIKRTQDALLLVRQGGVDAGAAIVAGTDAAVAGLNQVIAKAEAAALALFAMGEEGQRAGRKIEYAAGGAAEGHSPTGIKQIIVRTEEAHAALGVFSQDFLRAAQQMEEAAAGVAAVDMVPQDKYGELTGTLGGLSDTYALDKFDQLMRELQTLQGPDKTVFVEPPTTIPEGAVTVQITQEGATISVNALDNANMDEAWRNLIMPAYLKHLDNNADQLAERTETAVTRYRRRMG